MGLSFLKKDMTSLNHHFHKQRGSARSDYFITSSRAKKEHGFMCRHGHDTDKCDYIYLCHFFKLLSVSMCQCVSCLVRASFITTTTIRKMIKLTSFDTIISYKTLRT